MNDMEKEKIKLSVPVTPCSCKKKDCERHGNCAACIAHHKAHKRYAPYCMRESRQARRRKTGRTEETDKK